MSRPQDSRELPHNLDAEREVLGALMLTKDAVEAVPLILTEADFYAPNHSAVYAAALRAIAAGDFPSPKLLAQDLNGSLNGIDGTASAFLLRLQGEASMMTNPKTFANIVAELARRRRAIAQAGAIAHAAYAGDDWTAATTELLNNGPTAAGRFGELTTAELLELEPPDWLLADYLPINSLAMLYGPSGVYKSFIALDFALSIAVGAWWNGHAVKPGPVVYVAAEGASALGLRVRAWQAHNTIADLDDARFHPVKWVPRAVNLFDDVESAKLAELCRAHGAGLVVIDTLARCAVGADESSARDAGIIIDNLDRIRVATGGTVLAVHHTGKEASRGARGSSALRAAVDVELEASRVEHVVTLTNTKQKDAEVAQPFKLRRLKVAPSIVLTPDRGPRPGEEEPGLDYVVEQTLDALKAIELGTGISTSVWEDAASHYVDRFTFYRHRKILLELGLVENIGTEATPRYVSTKDPELFPD